MPGTSINEEAARIERGRRFVELHQSGCFLLPNAWDAGSARLLEAAGFEAIATTSAGIAFAHGHPDHTYYADSGPGTRIKRDVMIGDVRAMVDAVQVPVSADLEEGFGESADDVARTLELAIDAGAVGGNIEDFTGSRGVPLFDASLAIDRIRGARAAVDASGEQFVLVGRTDALLVGRSMSEAIQRANAYLAAGADCAFIPGASDHDTIARLVNELDGPLNVVMGLTGNALSMTELAALGVRRVTIGGSLARAMYGHLSRAARELREQGTFTYASDQISQEALNATFEPR